MYRCRCIVYHMSSALSGRIEQSVEILYKVPKRLKKTEHERDYAMEKLFPLLETPLGLAVGLTAVALVFLAGTALILKARSWLIRNQIMQRAERGRRLESRAGKLLSAEGYRILATQVPGEIRFTVNGEEVNTTVHADFLVKKQGCLFPADSKSGAAAIHPARAEVRRQMLEYCLTYGCDRALVVDMEEHQIYELGFDIPRMNRRGFGLTATLLLVLTSALAGALVCKLLS